MEEMCTVEIAAKLVDSVEISDWTNKDESKGLTVQDDSSDHENAKPSESDSEPGTR